MPLVVNIVNYCCMQKTLKETETEEAIFFCYILIIGDISVGVGAGHIATPMVGRCCHYENTDWNKADMHQISVEQNGCVCLIAVEVK